VDYFAFEYLGSLQNLDLSHNDIEFGKSPFVNSPDSNFMGFGDISSYSPLHQCSNLRKLNLSFNRIDTIYEDWRMSKLSLSNLDLSYNKITNITAIDLDFITK
jgi:Leucine-rich repeat (LRR) protein